MVFWFPAGFRIFAAVIIAVPLVLGPIAGGLLLLAVVLSIISPTIIIINK